MQSGRGRCSWHGGVKGDGVVSRVGRGVGGEALGLVVQEIKATTEAKWIVVGLV